MEPYWTVSSGVAVTHTLTCRECKRPIGKGNPLVARDGRKIRLCYHPQCFSGDADPRTQHQSSFHSNRISSSCLSSHAPREKGRGKFSTTYGLGGYAVSGTSVSNVETSSSEGEQSSGRSSLISRMRPKSRSPSRGDTSCESNHERTDEEKRAPGVRSK